MILLRKKGSHGVCVRGKQRSIPLPDCLESWTLKNVHKVFLSLVLLTVKTNKKSCKDDRLLVSKGIHTAALSVTPDSVGFIFMIKSLPASAGCLAHHCNGSLTRSKFGRQHRSSRDCVSSRNLVIAMASSVARSRKHEAGNLVRLLVLLGKIWN